MAKGLSAAKAKKMLEDGRVRGTALTEKQKKLFGAVAGGATPLKAINGGWLDKYQTGGSLPGASGMMYSRNSGSSAMSPPNLTKAQDGTVEYGTPEYKKAYEEGTFADVPNQLDEVVISGYNRNKLSPSERNLYNMFYKNSDVLNPNFKREEYAGKDNPRLIPGKEFTPQIDYNGYEITPKDLFRLNKEAGSPTVSNEPSWLAQLSPTKMRIEDGSNYFRAHADLLLNKMYIPPLEGAKGMDKYIAEIAHLHPDFNFTPTVSGTLDRIKRGIKERQFPDSSNYTSKEDFEHKTHSIAEDNILDYYFPNQKRDDWERILDLNRTPQMIEEAKVERLREKMDKRGITKYKGYQEGGSLPQAQDGDKVMYGTPEYEAAYKEGRFADVPNPLDEVVIDSGVDYEKYPLYDKLSVQEKEYFNDPGTIGRGVRRAAQTDRGLAEDTIDMVTGMLVKQPLAALQAPQSLMVEGIEALRGRDANLLNALTFDTQRLPSQTMGFEDKPGWDVGGSLNTAMDVLADPTNLVGAGIAKKSITAPFKNALKANSSNLIEASAMNPGIRQDLKNLNDKLGVVNTTSSQIRASEKFNKNWFNHPETIRRVEEMINQPTSLRSNMSETEILQDINLYQTMLDKSPKFLEAQKISTERQMKDLYAGLAKKNLETVQQKGRFTEVFDPDNIRHQDIDLTYEENPNYLGFYTGRTNQGTVNVPRAEKAGKNISSVFTHEDLHAITAGKKGYTDEAKQILNDAVGKDQDWWLNKINTAKDQKTREKLIDRLEYLARPQEIHARVHELRKAFNLKPGQEVSPSKIEAIMTKGLKGETPVDEDFFRLLGDKENFRKIFNKLPAFVPAAVGLGAVSQNKNGGKTPKAQDGYKVPTRQGVRLNYDAEGNVIGESTHLMKAEQLEGGTWVGFPSLFQNEDGKWIDMSGEKDWMNIYNEALNRSEVIEFGDDSESAIKFGEGSWKSPKMKNGGWLSKYENGGVIEDDRGQWAHPGKITKINSNNITMKGVNYPVLGVSDTGDTKMMQPGVDNYKYDGNSVTEYPMAQEGAGVNKEGVKQYKWFKNYMRSPKYKERLKKEFPDYSDNQIGQEVKARLNNVMQTRVGFLPRSSEISTGVGGTQGVYNADEYPGAIMLRPEYSASTSDVLFEPGNYLSGYNTIPLHEWSHAADDGGNRMPQSTTDLMLSKMKENSLGISKDKYYYTRPTEYLGRMQPLRYLMQQEGLYDAGTQDFTKEDLEKAKQNKTIKNNEHFQDLMKNVNSDESFIELMNKVASVNQKDNSRTMMAKNGKSLVELDQLTNFTNYNTSQPGGWLNKYN